MANPVIFAVDDEPAGHPEVQPDGCAIGVEEHHLAPSAGSGERGTRDRIGESSSDRTVVDIDLENRPTHERFARTTPDLGFQALRHGQAVDDSDFDAVPRNRSSGSASWSLLIKNASCP